MRFSHVAALCGAFVLVLAGARITLHQPLRAQDGSNVQPTAPAAPAGNPERGRYIVERVAMCHECHSGRDAQGDIAPGTRLLGGPVPVRPPWPAEWALQAPRISGLPGYDDELALRLLMQGAIGRDGAQLRPPMPRFRMTRQDASDVIAFLRSAR